MVKPHCSNFSISINTFFGVWCFFLSMLLFFFWRVLRPLKISSLILSQFNRKVGWKWEIPEKIHLTTHKQNLACLTRVSERGSNPQRWDDKRFRALKISILNHLATGAADFYGKVDWPSFISFLILSVSFSSVFFCALMTATYISRSVRHSFSAFRYFISFSICNLQEFAVFFLTFSIVFDFVLALIYPHRRALFNPIQTSRNVHVKGINLILNHLRSQNGLLSKRCY